MNRRQFLRDSALAVMAVSVAPATVLAAKELMIDGDAIGPIPVVFGQFRIDGREVFTQDHPSTEAAIEEMEASSDYYSIRWPLVSEKYVSGSLIIIDGEMFHIAEASHDA